MIRTLVKFVKERYFAEIIPLNNVALVVDGILKTNTAQVAQMHGRLHFREQRLNLLGGHLPTEVGVAVFGRKALKLGVVSTRSFLWVRAILVAIANISDRPDCKHLIIVETS